jgi:gas vesicle protein
MSDSRFSCFVLGIAVGAAAGLLFAPKPGQETRDELRHRAEEGKDYLRKRSVELKSQAEEALERGRTVVQGQRDQLSAALEAGRKAYRDATGKDPAEAPATAGD